MIEIYWGKALVTSGSNCEGEFLTYSLTPTVPEQVSDFRGLSH